MKQKLFLIALFAGIMALPVFSADYSLTFDTKREPKPGEYVVYVKSENWGAVTEKLVIYSNSSVQKSEINVKDFKVKNVQVLRDVSDAKFGNAKETLPVKNAYLCTPYGEPVADSVDKGIFVAVEFNLTPNDESTLFLSSSLLLNVKDCFLYSVENSRLKIKSTRATGFVFPEAQKFKTRSFTEGDVTLKYSYFEPEKKSMDTPLIIWFHGIAEGGSNIYMPLYGTKAAALSEEKIQSYFKDGAYVIYPQCPTGWLETTTKDMFGLRMWEPVDVEGALNKAANPLLKVMDFFSSEEDKKTRIKVEGIEAKVSYYSEACKKLLDKFIAEHPDVDTNHIYAGGCSAGGYMTINMLLQYPSFFAAGFTSCEAFLDSKITDDDIQTLSKIPLWFVQAKNDQTMKMDTHSFATFTRLKKAEAPDVHYTLFDDVRDSRFEYDGHASWIYISNDECADEGLNLFKWLSSKRKNNGRAL
ncbi:MAG: prolyl oligopeptidase family serine peptidase [Treponema sp.]|nr:prolyl oligopeptidase family serine peptidase [Treponema sp.]